MPMHVRSTVRYGSFAETGALAETRARSKDVHEFGEMLVRDRAQNLLDHLK